MRRPTLLAALIVVVSGITGLSQGEIITKAEFDAVNNAATHPNLRWKGVSYRSIIRTETTSSIGKQFDYASRSVTEFGSDGASHSLYESRMASGEPKRSETVRIGDTTYSRTGNAAWIRKTGSVKLGGGEGASEIKRAATHELSSEAEYKFLGSVEFRGKAARMYQKTESRRGVDTTSGAETMTISTTQYWFDSDGTLLKSVFKADSRRGDMTSQTGVVMEYELDATIRITAPNVP